MRISELALELLKLDQVWWLVSPQNPLKAETDMAPYARRLRAARALAHHPQIRVSEYERRLGTRYTADTLAALAQRRPNTRFVWIMGADNLEEIVRWRHWTRIFKTVPVAVFDRPSYSLRALRGKATQRFGDARIEAPRAAELADHAPPAWVFLDVAHEPTSATSLREAERAGLINR